MNAEVVPEGQHVTTRRAHCTSTILSQATETTQQQDEKASRLPDRSHFWKLRRLGDQGGGSGGLVLEGRRELLLLDVVSRQSVDSGFDQNESAGGKA